MTKLAARCPAALAVVSVAGAIAVMAHGDRDGYMLNLTKCL